MSDNSVEVERSGALAVVWLNRPHLHNAFDPVLITGLTETLITLGEAEDVRVLVLAGRGRSFSAGAQIQWMQQQGAASVTENIADAEALANMLEILASFPKPTVARVHGAAIGGGMGLVAACDVAIGTTSAIFATSEVRLGLIPATIAPYVIRAVGERQARRLFLTGERLSAEVALRLGLLHEVVESEAVDDRLREITQALLMGAPEAQMEAKKLVADVAGRRVDQALMQDTARRIALRRASTEGAEGLSAFLEKRSAAWVPQG